MENIEGKNNKQEEIQDETEALVEKEMAFIDALKLHGVKEENFAEWIEQYGADFRRVFIEKANEGKYSHEDFEEFAKELEQIINGNAELDSFPKLKGFLERIDRKLNGQ